MVYLKVAQLLRSESWSQTQAVRPGSLPTASRHQPKMPPMDPHACSRLGSQERCSSLLLVSPPLHGQKLVPTPSLCPPSLPRPRARSSAESWRQTCCGPCLHRPPPPALLAVFKTDVSFLKHLHLPLAACLPAHPACLCHHNMLLRISQTG